MACANRALYTGITNRLAKRLRDHNAGRGARYTRSFRPVSLVWKERHPTQTSAARREAWIKSRTRLQKLALMRGAVGRATRR